MDTYLVSLILAFLVTLSVTPGILAVARRRGLVDAAGQSHRKVHGADKPRLGGIGIVAGFYAPIAALTVYKTRVGDSLLGSPELAGGLLGGGLIIALLGLYDDLRGASPRVKLAVQILVATWVTSLGFQIGKVNFPFLPVVDLGLLAWPVTILWIVGVTNAVNLIDGLDGLAAGIALFGLAPVAILALYKGNVILALICCALTGALLGFLVYNFHPARIFMGDTGSMFVGFVLAVVTVQTGSKGRIAVSMLMPILALGVPLLDTMLAIGRRAWFGQSVFAGDRQHIHHLLVATGLSHRNTVLVMYAFAAAFASLSLVLSLNRDLTSGLVLLASVLIASVLLRKLGYLSVPAALGDKIALVAAMRNRNRLLHEMIPQINRHLDASSRAEDVAAAAGELAFATGASWARLDLSALLPGQPLRSWEWPEDGITGGEIPREMNFPITLPDGRRIGLMTLGWRDGRSFHEALIPAIDRGCADLAARVGLALAEVTSEGRVASPQARPWREPACGP